MLEYLTELMQLGAMKELVAAMLTVIGFVVTIGLSFIVGAVVYFVVNKLIK